MVALRLHLEHSLFLVLDFVELVYEVDLFLVEVQDSIRGQLRLRFHLRLKLFDVVAHCEATHVAIRVHSDQLLPTVRACGSRLPVVIEKQLLNRCASRLLTVKKIALLVGTHLYQTIFKTDGQV